MKLVSGITISLVLLAGSIEWMVDQKSVGHISAEKHIGDCRAIEFSGAEAFRSSDKTAVIIKAEGVQGPIEALFVLSNDSIELFEILRSNEGLNRSALNDPHFLRSFQQDLKDLPLKVDAVTGATISSQMIIDELNRIIKDRYEKDA